MHLIVSFVPLTYVCSVEACIKALGGPSGKKIDLFECGRVDPRVSIEDTMRTLKGFVEVMHLAPYSLFCLT